jgi:2-hydroxychromene-2-carboxylate isomerase
MSPGGAGRSPIEFYFELASPYSYLASLQLEAIARSANRSLEWKPIDIEAVWAAQGVLEAYGAVRRLKRGYVIRDSQRCAAALGIRFARPVTSARDTCLAKLAYWGLRATDRELAQRFIQAVWHRHFCEGLAIGTAQDLAQAFANGGLDAEAIASAARAPKAREDQDACNAQAIAVACFGIPWIVVDGDSFFGQDRLDQVAARCRAGG